jgi:hypothetical protein
MNTKNRVLFCFFVLTIGILLLPDQVSATTTMPSNWNREAHGNLLTKVDEIKGFIFSTPVLIGAVFAFAMAIFHTFREGSAMPLLTVIGIIILASLAPMILDVLYPINAQGMVLPS